METLQEFRHIAGVQAQKRAAGFAQATGAAAIAGSGGNRARQGQARVAGAAQMPRLVERLVMLEPPKFHGRGDPETVPRWVEGLEKAFKFLERNDEEKGALAACQLRDGAGDWWNATEGRVFP